MWTSRLDDLLKEAERAGVLKRGNTINRKLPTPHVKIPKVEDWFKELEKLAAIKDPKKTKETICLLEGVGGMGKSTCALDLALQLQGAASRQALLHSHFLTSHFESLLSSFMSSG